MATQRAKQKARQAKEELYRQLVLEAAERVFARKGYDDAKVGEVAEESGISLQTLYSVFPGKAAIYQAVHENGDEELHRRAVEASKDVSDPLSGVLAGLRVTTLYFLEHPDFLRMRLQGGFAWGTDTASARSLGRTEHWRAAMEMLRNACQRCVDEGLFVRKDPGLIARMTIALQQVELAHWLDGGMQGDPEAVAEAIEQVVERAFRSPGGPAHA